MGFSHFRDVELLFFFLVVSGILAFLVRPHSHLRVMGNFSLSRVLDHTTTTSTAKSKNDCRSVREIHGGAITVFWRALWSRSSRYEEVCFRGNESIFFPLSPENAFHTNRSFFAPLEILPRVWCVDQVFLDMEKGDSGGTGSETSACFLSAVESGNGKGKEEKSTFASRSTMRVINFSTPTLPSSRLHIWWMVYVNASRSSNPLPPPRYGGRGGGRRQRRMSRILLHFFSVDSLDTSLPPPTPLPPPLLIKWTPDTSSLCPPPLTLLHVFSDLLYERTTVFPFSSSYSSAPFSSFPSSPTGTLWKQDNIVEGGEKTVKKYVMKVMCGDWRNSCATFTEGKVRNRVGRCQSSFPPSMVEIFQLTFWWNTSSNDAFGVKMERSASPIVRLRTGTVMSMVISSKASLFSPLSFFPSLRYSFSYLLDVDEKTTAHHFSPFSSPSGSLDDVVLIHQENNKEREEEVEDIFLGVFSEFVPDTIEGDGKDVHSSGRFDFPSPLGTFSHPSSFSSSRFPPSTTLDASSTRTSWYEFFSHDDSPGRRIASPSRLGWRVHRLDTPWLPPSRERHPLGGASSPTFLCYHPRFHLTGVLWDRMGKKRSSFFHLFHADIATGSTRVLLDISSSALSLPFPFHRTAPDAGDSAAKSGNDRRWSDERGKEEGRRGSRLLESCHLEEDLTGNVLRVRVQLVARVRDEKEGNTAVGDGHDGDGKISPFFSFVDHDNPSQKKIGVEAWGRRSRRIPTGLPEMTYRTTQEREKCSLEKKVEGEGEEEVWEAVVTLESNGGRMAYVSTFQYIPREEVNRNGVVGRGRGDGGVLSFGWPRKLLSLFLFDEGFHSSFPPSHWYEEDRSEFSDCATFYAWEWWGFSTSAFLPSISSSFSVIPFPFFSQWTCRATSYSVSEIVELFYCFTIPLFVILCIGEFLSNWNSR